MRTRRFGQRGARVLAGQGRGLINATRDRSGCDLRGRMQNFGALLNGSGRGGLACSDTEHCVSVLRKMRGENATCDAILRQNGQPFGLRFRQDSISGNNADCGSSDVIRLHAEFEVICCQMRRETVPSEFRVLFERRAPEVRSVSNCGRPDSIDDHKRCDRVPAGGYGAG